MNISTNILKTLETSSSVGMFARDTGGCLISRLAVSRSSDESREIGIAEISESSLFYFSAPILAKTGAKVFSKIYDVDISKSISEIKNSDDNIQKRIKLGKFGQIASVFSVILPAIFAIAPLRNMVTLSKTGKEKFTNVVELDKTKKNGKEKEAKVKSKNLIKRLLEVMGLGIGATIGFLGLAKNKKFYEKMLPVIDKTIKHFDFTKKGDLELKHYGLLIYPVSIASYFYASRDKYEIQENIRRFSVTVPLLFFGERLIQNPLYKMADKKYGTNIFNNGNIKSYEDIKNLPDCIRKKSIKAKNMAYASTFLINTIGIAMSVALLNRFETKRLYNKDNKGNIY